LSNPRFVKVCSTFTLLYFTWILSTRNHENQLLRIGASGSLTFLFCEMCFFPFDTLNFQVKLSTNNATAMTTLRTNFRMYGMWGIYRGFTTSYYSSTTAGYFFFVVYKGLKLKMKEYFKPKT